MATSKVGLNQYFQVVGDSRYYQLGGSGIRQVEQIPSKDFIPSEMGNVLKTPITAQEADAVWRDQLSAGSNRYTLFKNAITGEQLKQADIQGYLGYAPSGTMATRSQELGGNVTGLASGSAKSGSPVKLGSGSQAGTSYADLVAAEGGMSINPQTGAVTYAANNPAASGARGNDAVVDASGNIIKQAAPTTIQPGQISGGTPLTLPQPDYQMPSDMADTLVAGANAGNAALASTTGPMTDLEKKNKTLTDELLDLYGDSTGRAKTQAEEEKKAGVDALKKQLQDLTNQANIKAAEYDQLSTSIQGKPITMDSIIGAQAQVRLMKASELGLISARQQAVQGNLTLALETASRAVDLKYAGIEEEITARERQLQLIQPLLNAEQQRIAQAQAEKLALQKEALQEQKGVQKQAIDFAYKNNIETPFYTRAGTVYRTSDGKAYSTPEEFFADGGARDFSNAPVVNIASNEKLLTVSEAQKLGVPYGTTQGQAAAMGITPFNKASDSNSSITSYAKQYPQGVVGPGSGNLQGECGVYVQTVAGAPKMGNTAATKHAMIDSQGISADQWRQEPRAGDVIVFDYNHVAVVNKVANGYITLSESNYNKDKRVTHTRTLSINDPSIYGAWRATGPLKTSVIPRDNPIPVSQELARVKQIIADNPGEWGNAADQINAEFPGRATHYDDLLKKAYATSNSSGTKADDI